MTDDADEYTYVEYGVEDGVATLRLARPEKKNAINGEMRTEIRDALGRFDGDEEAVVLVLTGSGDSFSAGTDIDELEERLPDSPGETVTMPSFALPERVEALDEPVVAMLNGLALGGGLELALAADFRVAAAGIEVGFPEISLAGFPGEGGTQRLVRETNVGTAMRLVLTGEFVSAERARRDGIVQEVYEPDALEAKTMELAHAMADREVSALVLAKTAVTMADRTEFQQGIELEGLLANVVEAFPERKERLAAFRDE